MGLVALWVAGQLALPASVPTADAPRSMKLLEEPPSPRERLVRTLIAPLSAAGGTATGTGIGVVLGFAVGYLADLLVTPPLFVPNGFGLPAPRLANTMLRVGAAIGGAIGYGMGIIGPGRLFEPTLSAQRRAILIGAVIFVVVGAAWLVTLAAGVLMPALPFLITGSALVAFAVPPLVDLTRPRVEGVTLVAF